MPFAPTPKNPGDLIRSQDWNQAMDEIVRLESAKVGTAGGTVSGTLSVQNLGLGTPGPVMANRPLTVRGTSGTYINVIADGGTHEVLLGADSAGGIVSTITNHDLHLRAGGNVNRLTVKADGDVGIGTTTPAARLDIVGTSWNQHLRLTNTGTSGAGPCLFFNAVNRDWAILGTNVTAGAGDQKLGFYDATSNQYRMVIDQSGNVGIGTTSPAFALDVADRMRVRQGSSTAGIWMFQSTPNADRAFVGMADDNFVGFWGNTGAGWGLRVNTTTGNVVIAGSLTAGGSKTGYVVDNFINAVGETLEQGDVVILGGNEISHYYGVENSIPVPEVDLTDRAYDTRVCGIVASVALADSLPSSSMQAPAQAEKGTRRKKAAIKVQPLEALAALATPDLDTTQVGAGQLGQMVTLGAYAWCKVDADIAPIAAGDLLTTSPTRGHAQKVLEPERAAGTILGKALGPLKKGKGKIPILVSLQ